MKSNNKNERRQENLASLQQTYSNTAQFLDKKMNKLDSQTLDNTLENQALRREQIRNLEDKLYK